MATNKSGKSLQAKKKARTARNNKLEDLIDELRELHSEAFANYGRFAFYDYLLGVYRGVERIQGIQEALRDNMGPKLRSNHTPFHALITLSSDRDKRTRSKWAVALNSCAKAGVPPLRMKHFLRAQGGPIQFGSRNWPDWVLRKRYEKFQAKVD